MEYIVPIIKQADVGIGLTVTSLDGYANCVIYVFADGAGHTAKT